MNFISIRGKSSKVGFEDAILKGLPDDGGLFVPDELPSVDHDQLVAWKNLSYVDVTKELIRLFIPESAIATPELHQLIDRSFSGFLTPKIIPHHSLESNPGIIIQEIFQGPTLSFKDVAMGFVVNLFEYFLQKNGQHLNLMVATSGDTGPAAAYACRDKDHLDIWLLFPPELISEEQRRQMTTIDDENIHSIAIPGTKNGSDDLDDIIRRLYSDTEFKDRMNLSSVNSINWGRVMLQTAHYFYGYLQNVKEVGDPLIFSVPCGAFGNLCAGTIAYRMGLPIHSFLAANNRNGIFTRVFEEGVFSKANVVNTYASAIDIAVPMNLWRYLYYQLDQNQDVIDRLMLEYESGSVIFKNEDYLKIKSCIEAYVVDDDSILSTIRDVYNRNNYLLDPHGAVAVAAAIRKTENLNSRIPIVCLATAHPAKFPEVTNKALGEIPPPGRHVSIEDSLSKSEKFREVQFPNAVDFFKNLS